MKGKNEDPYARSDEPASHIIAARMEKLNYTTFITGKE
jgi:hypothetical protein